MTLATGVCSTFCRMSSWNWLSHLIRCWPSRKGGQRPQEVKREWSGCQWNSWERLGVISQWPVLQRLRSWAPQCWGVEEVQHSIHYRSLSPYQTATPQEYWSLLRWVQIIFPVFTLCSWDTEERGTLPPPIMFTFSETSKASMPENWFTIHYLDLYCESGGNILIKRASFC